MTPRQSGGQQATANHDQAQGSPDGLTEALQPIMEEFEHHIDTVIQEQMQQARQMLRDGMGMSSNLGDLHAPDISNAVSGDPDSSSQSPSDPQNAEQAADGTPQNQRNGQNGKMKGDKDSPLTSVLQQEILDAMDPVLDDLRENVEAAVHQQLEYVLKMSEEDLHNQVNQAIEPMRQEVENQVDQTVKMAKAEQEKPPQTKLQEAITRTVKALKETMQWLARTLRSLFKTVIALLKAVLNLLVVVLLALFEGLKSIGGAAGKGASAIGGGIVGGLKNMVQGALKGVAGKLIPDADTSKQNGQPRQQQEQSSPAAA